MAESAVGGTGEGSNDQNWFAAPTLVVLEELAGAARTGWRVTGTALAVAATARSVIRRR
jgi:hypothetical protein